MWRLSVFGQVGTRRSGVIGGLQCCSCFFSGGLVSLGIIQKRAGLILLGGFFGGILLQFVLFFGVRAGCLVGDSIFLCFSPICFDIFLRFRLGFFIAVLLCVGVLSKGCEKSGELLFTLAQRLFGLCDLIFVLSLLRRITGWWAGL